MLFFDKVPIIVALKIFSYLMLEDKTSSTISENGVGCFILLACPYLTKILVYLI